MVYYSELKKFFPPVVKFPGKSIYDETKIAYDINKSKMPLKTPPAGEVYNYEILEQLQLVREELHKNQTEEELRNKLYTLYTNWGPLNLNILNKECLITIFEIINKIDKNKESMAELIKLAENLNSAIIENKEISKKIKPKMEEYKKDIGEIISKMQNISTSIESKDLEEKEDKKLNDLLELLKIDNERVRKQTDFYKPQ